jgi:hypothetical protein
LAARALFKKRLNYMMNGHFSYIEEIRIKKLLGKHDFSNLDDDFFAALVLNPFNFYFEVFIQAASFVQKHEQEF